MSSTILKAAQLPLASASALGVVQVDGTTLTAASGVISAQYNQQIFNFGSGLTQRGIIDIIPPLTAVDDSVDGYTIISIQNAGSSQGGAITSTMYNNWQAKLTNPMTAVGDLIIGGTSGAATRLAIGSNTFVLTSNGTTATWAASAGGSAANPISSVSLSAVNGSATTFMRSDAAPALDQTIAPTWTGLHTHSANGIGAIPTDRIFLSNTTAAATGAQQLSPAINWQGQGWKATATAASQSVDYRAYVLPIQGTTSPTGLWKLDASINAGAFSNLINIDTAGSLVATGAITATGVVSGSSYGSVLFAATNGANIKTQAGGVGGISLTGNAPVSNKFTYNTGFVFSNGGASSTATSMINFQGGSFSSPTTGNCFSYLFNNDTFTASSGSAAYWHMYLAPVINQTSTANGTVSILTIQPTITAITASLNAIYITAGRILSAASTTTYPSLNIPAGTAPTAPTHGDVWTDTNHVYSRLNGVTYQLDQQTGSSKAGTVATITGINAKATSNNLTYTNATGSIVVVERTIIRCTAVTGFSSGPTISVGTTAGGSDIFPATTLGALSTTSSIYGFDLVGMSVSVPNGGTIYVNVTSAGSATGTYTVAADVRGYTV